MDTTDPEIQFDENGVCNHCRTYDAVASKNVFRGEEGRREIERIIATIKEKGKNKPYDCIIGVSGGVDSTTVAYHVKRLGLRPLAVHLDNGWDSEIGVKNIENALRTLGIDLYTHVIDWEEFKDIQLSFLKSSIPNAEVPTDMAITALMHRQARKQRLEYIIAGSNVVTEAIMPKSWMCDNLDLRLLKGIHKKFGTLPIKTFPTISVSRRLYNFMTNKIKYWYILNYIDYNKEESKKLIERQLGWRSYGPKHGESIYTRFFQCYILPVKYNIDKRKAHLSTLIASGQMRRAQALEEMKKPVYDPGLLQQDKEFVIKKLGLTEGEFEEIMNLPLKTHLDYPNSQFIYKALTGMARLFSRITGKSRRASKKMERGGI